jgi:hypothetical protein
VGVIIFVRHPVEDRDGAFCPRFKVGFEDEIDKVFANVGESRQKIFRDKDRCFGYPEFDSSGMFAVKVGQEVIVALPGEGFVEGFTQ